jgi:hypothetical protein
MHVTGSKQARPIAALVATLLAAACGNSASTSTSVTAPSDVRCQPSVTSSPTSFGSAGGTGTASVTVSRECAWSAASASPWLSIVSGREGQGDGSVTYRVGENVEPVARQAALTIGERQVAVSQQAAACRYDAGFTTAGPLPTDGGEALVEVRTHSACAWTAASQVPWAVVVSPASGRGNAAIRLTVDPNPGVERPIEILVGGERISKMQSARGAAPPGPSPSPGPAPTPPPAPGPAPAPAPAPSPSPAPPPAPAPDPTPGPGPSPAPGPAPKPSPGPKEHAKLDGPIQELSGSCPVLTFRVDRQGVATTPSTKFKGLPCESLRNNTDVKVDGTLMSNGIVVANEVKGDEGKGKD